MVRRIHKYLLLLLLRMYSHHHWLLLLNWLENVARWRHCRHHDWILSKKSRRHRARSSGHLHWMLHRNARWRSHLIWKLLYRNARHHELLHCCYGRCHDWLLLDGLGVEQVASTTIFLNNQVPGHPHDTTNNFQNKQHIQSTESLTKGAIRKTYTCINHVILSNTVKTRNSFQNIWPKQRIHTCVKHGNLSYAV